MVFKDSMIVKPASVEAVDNWGYLARDRNKKEELTRLVDDAVIR